MFVREAQCAEDGYMCAVGSVINAPFTPTSPSPVPYFLSRFDLPLSAHPPPPSPPSLALPSSPLSSTASFLYYPLPLLLALLSFLRPPRRLPLHSH